MRSVAEGRADGHPSGLHSLATAPQGGEDHAARALLPLLIWLSPAFPVGAFAYSHGLEWAVECGDVRDAATLQAWIDDLLAFGSLRADLILLAAAMRAGARDDPIHDINDLALALAPSRERLLETASQGNAFRDLMLAVWPHPALDRLALVRDVAYPVALGVTAAAHGLSHGLGFSATSEAFALALVASLISAAVRLGPIGQTDGQRVTAALLPAIRACAAHATTSTLDDLGSACLRADIASMKHETQYSRLFRS